MFMDFIYTVYTEQHGMHRNIFCADMPKARGDLFEVKIKTCYDSISVAFNL